MCKNLVEKYNNSSDDELILLSRNGDDYAFNQLLERYKTLLRQICLKHTQDCVDYEDLLQEATISFYYAVLFYDFKSSSFSTFISVCVDRGIISAIKKASAKKRVPPNMLIPLDEDINSSELNPENLVLNKESSAEVSTEIKDKLSKLEFNVLMEFFKSGSYDVVAETLGISRKSVDNALTRLRKKFDSIN